MRLSDFSVKNYQFTIVVFGMLVAIGINATMNIPRSEDPIIPIPIYIITAIYPGASPTDLEQLVVEPIEDAIYELDDVKTIKTSIEDGVAVVRAEFESGVDADDKYDEVLREMNVVRPDLPADLLDFDVLQASATNVQVVQAALVSERATYRALEDAAERLREQFERVPGVKDAETWAHPAREVRVSIDLQKMARFGILPGQVVGALQANNTAIPGGAVDVGPRKFNIKTSGNYRSLEDIRRTVVAGDAGHVVLLQDVADVAWDYGDATYVGRYNGRRAVFVSATMKEGQNIFAVRDGLYAEMDRFEPGLPPAIALERGFDQSVNVSKRLDRLTMDFGIAIALVLLTLLPLGFRASLIVMISIPLSLAIGIALLFFTGFSINQLSIVGFVIALGLLVDDSIVVVENITRYLREGYSRRDAAILATKQISVAVVGCTATLIFAFVPLLVLPGASGDFIRSMPVAVVYAVLGSLLVSLTIIPFLASLLLKREEQAEGNRVLQVTNRVIEGSYSRLLNLSLVHPKTTLAVAGVLFAGSLTLVPAIGFSLFPKAGIPQFLLVVETPDGSSLSATDETARFVEGVLASRPEVRYFMTNVGKGNPFIYYNNFPSNERTNVAEVLVELHRFDPKTTPAFFDTLRTVFAAYPGARIVLKEFEQGPPIEAPIAVRLLGPDLDTLRVVAARVEDLVAATPGARDVSNPVLVSKTDLKVDVNRTKAGLFGVLPADVDRVVRMSVAGYAAGEFREADGDEYPITVRLPVPASGNGLRRQQLEALDRVYVPSTTGAQVPLRQVATVRFEGSSPTIQRHNRERAVTITAYTRTGYNTAEVTTRVREQLDRMALPPGYRVAFGGEVESQQESFGGLGTAILVAVFSILAILVLEFRTFRSTLIVASVIPLGLVGGLLGLFLSGYTLSFMAAIGFVALIGIEIKTSILLVDFTNELRQEGLSLDEAIQKAGEIRFLPIVLTTLTAIGGLLPLALQGSSLYSPLAIVIIGGLISSTLLARLVTPVMYKLLAPPVAPVTPAPGLQAVPA